MRAVLATVVGLVVSLAGFSAVAQAGGIVAPGPGERAITPAQPEGGRAGAAGPAGDSRAPAPTTGVNFLAVKGGTGSGSESGFIPPDTTGAIGPSNVVVPLNGRIKIFNRAGAEQYSATLNDFFSTVLPSGNAFDPRVEFDRLTNRWFVIGDTSGADNAIMIATSNGPDVSAGKSAFTFRSFVHSAVLPSAAGTFADYPTLATDANSLLIGTNNFTSSYVSSSLFVLDKAALIGGTVDAVGFGVGTPSSGMFTPQVAENDNPGSTQSYVIAVDNAAFSVLDYRRVTYPGGVPTLSAQVQVPVPATALSLDDVPAQGSTVNVDALDDRLYEAQVAIDPVSGQPRLWTAHNMEMNASGVATNSGTRIGSRWYELGNLAGTPNVIQSGTLFDSAAANPDSYWLPAIAASGQGHAVIGTSVAGPARFVGIALAQRFAGDPAGTLGPVNFAQPGAGSYTVDFGSGRNRWGDYSQVSVDPTDNMTFWAFQEYVNAVNQWGVRVLEVKAPPPATPTSATGVPQGLEFANVTVTGSSSSGSGFYEPGTSFSKHLEVAVSGGVTVNSVTVDSPTQLTVSVNTTGAALGAKNVTVTNPDGQASTGNAILAVTSGADNRTLTVSTAGGGSGSVTGPGINCPGDCSQTYADGTNVSLSATPAPGSSFGGYSGDCNGLSCDLTMSADRSVAATFTADAPPPPPVTPPAVTPPSNQFTLGKVKRNTKNGTATLEVTVPDGGTVVLGGKGIKPQRPLARPSAAAKIVATAGTVRLKIKPKGAKKKTLKRKGKVKVTAEVTYTPTGGNPATQSQKIKLKRKRRR